MNIQIPTICPVCNQCVNKELDNCTNCGIRTDCMNVVKSLIKQAILTDEREQLDRIEKKIDNLNK